MKIFTKTIRTFVVALLLVNLATPYTAHALSYEKSENVLREISVGDMETIKALKSSLNDGQKKLSTNLLKLVNDSFLLPNEQRQQIESEMVGSKQLILENDSVKNINKLASDRSHKDLAYVYVYVEPSASISIIDSLSWEVIDKDENNHLAVALVELDKLETLASLSGVRSISSVLPPVTRSGSVVTEGDIIHKTANVRSNYSQSGAGIKIGVISDGVDNIASAKSTGDLPAGVTVLSNSIGGDEGTAMLEIIYDMTPSASLYFHDCGSNIVAFNSAIDDLVAAGVNVIVDDIGWITEPFFEDGTIASHIVSVLAANNIAYVSAAGNSLGAGYGDGHYQGNYYNDGYNFHDFSRGTGDANNYLYLNIPNNGSVKIILQWNDNFGSSGNDYDLLLFNTNGYSLLAASGQTQNGTGNPLEAFIYTNNTGNPIVAEIDIINQDGLASSRILETFVYPSNGTWVYNNNLTSSDSIFGHPAVPGVIAVGAIAANEPGNDTIEPFSSQGPVTIIGQGQRLKPDISGIDGVSVTGVGGFGSPFYGTSAAAPHIAAIVAQLWGQNPSATGNEIKNLIYDTAVDLGGSGFDYVFGHGRADALFAFQSLPDKTPPILSNINVTNIATSTATISWTTDEPATSKVYYSTNSPVGSTFVSDNTLVTAHSINLTGLSVNTSYHFYVESTDGDDNTSVSIEDNFITVSGNTEVSGNISVDTTWTLENSPYIVTGTLQILDTATLTIEPGVVIKFNADAELNIGGELIAVGTEDNRITFTSNQIIPQSKDWGGITFINGSIGAVFGEDFDYLDGNVLKYCDVEYGDGINSEEVIYISNTNVTNSGGINLSYANGSLILNNHIEFASGYGIGLTDTDDAYIQNNLITNNNHGIGIVTNSNGNTIEANTITGNGPGSGSTTQSGTAISVSYGALNNIIKSNIISENISEYWSIVQLSESNVFQNNEVTNNNADHVIYIGKNSNIVTYNNIYSNVGFNIKTTYDHMIGNPSDYYIDATNNYWGTTISSEIDDKIYDYYDDISLGKVIYEPYAMSLIDFDDTTAPVITLTGDATVEVIVDTAYVDDGAIATDNVDTSVTVVVNNPVDTSVIDTYTVTYNATDTAGNVADEVTRTVNVVDAPDETAPTLSEVTPVATPTKDTTPNYTFNSNEAGTINYSGSCTSVTTVATAGNNTVTFNALTQGIYNNCGLTVTDASGNTSLPLTITQFIIDTTAPVITLNGEANVEVIVGDTYTELGAVANDTLDGDFFATPSGVVNANVVGIYTVTYNATDIAGNTATPVQRIINVIDNTKPTITLNGDSEMTIYVGETFSDPLYTATDNYDGNITSSVVVAGDTVNTNTPGDYVITYNVTDSSGNTATEKTRTVHVILDAINPSITLIGEATMTLNVFETFVDPGYSASDNIDGNITSSVVVAGDTVNTNAPGNYVITYNVTDSSGNAATQKTRTVQVVDLGYPVINLTGSLVVELSEGHAYVEPGYTANDNVDGNITSSVVVAGDLVTASTTAGIYTITYNVTDSSGNAATEKTRKVYVFKNVSAGDIASLFTSGILGLPSDATASSTSQIIVNKPLVISVGGSSITLPQGTIITAVGGVNFDPSLLTASSLATVSGLGSTEVVDGVLQWGISDLGLQFSEPIILKIFVGIDKNGQTLTIKRSVGGASGWTNDGIVDPATCVVVDGYCHFSAIKASYYAVIRTVTPPTPPSSGGGGGGGGGSHPVAPVAPKPQVLGIKLSEGQLVALEGVKDAAVYYINTDGKKYVFPDSKTYFTWYNNFNGVKRISIATLDSYPNGGVMPCKAGTKLITHANTAKVYAVEPDGVIRHITSEKAAANLYGPKWSTLVQDFIPGFFAVSYKVGADMGELLPTGTLVKNTDKYYYIDNGVKRKFDTLATLEQNGFDSKYAIEANDLSKYSDGVFVNITE